nr:MAG TPA: hypothetical protein [Caudoviricetes sp.]
MHFLTWFASTKVYSFDYHMKLHYSQTKFGFYSSLSDPAKNLAFIVD